MPARRRPGPKKNANPVIPSKSILWSAVLTRIETKDVNLKELAAATDVSLSNLYDWIALRHWPPVNKAERVAKALGISITVR
jgi:hypothetical protein